MLLQYGKDWSLSRELCIYFYFFLEMDFSVAKALTFVIEIFRCRMKQEQLQIQNTGKNLTNECLKSTMLHMSKLRLLPEGAGCRGYVLLTSAMRFSNFVSKFFIAALTCES